MSDIIPGCMKTQDWSVETLDCGCKICSGIAIIKPE